MKRLAILILLALAAPVAAPAAAREPRLRPAANPSAVIARELEFAQAAQDKGQWTAFRAFAAPDAVMFVPEMVLAQGWLKDRADPPVAVRWQTVEVWSSCDGSLVVSHGAWQRPNQTGYFTTIWQRQKDGNYRFVLDHGDVLAEPLAVPEMIPAHVADCPARTGPAGSPPRDKAQTAKSAPIPFDPARRGGRSDDGTVAWHVVVAPDGARNLSVEWSRDGAMDTVLVEEVAATDRG